MLKKNKKIEIKEEVKIDDYQREIKLLDNFMKACKNYGLSEISGVTSSGNALYKTLNAKDLIKRYKLEPLLKLLKENI